MKKLVALTILLFLALVQAQSPLRVLVLPFDATRSFEPYGLGLATGLQRTLNSLDGIYAPSVAEAGLFVTRAHDAGLEAIDVATEAFAATVVVSGSVEGSGDSLDVTLVFAGPDLPEAEQLRLRLDSDPAGALAGVSEAVARQLGRNDPSQLQRVGRLAEEAPELASLDAVARASSRLGSNLGELTAAAELNSDSSWALSESARALALAGRSGQAIEEAARAVAASEEDAEALVIKGIVANAGGEEAMARRSFESALALNSSHALALVGLAELAADDDEARRLLRRALEASPRQVEAVLALARLEGNHQQALQFLRRASSHLPESVDLHRAFITRAVEAGDPAGALAYLRQVTSQPLSTSPALYAQASGLPESLSEEALGLVQEGRERFPESSGLQLTEAELLRRAGRDQEAIAVLEALRERYPNSVEVANSLAIALAETGETERAREVLRGVAGDSETVQLNLGRLLLEAGQARAAVSTLEPLVEQDDNDSEALTLYGIALGRIGRMDAALEALDRALAVDPDSEAASRARTLIEQRQRIVGEDVISFEGEAATSFEQGLSALEAGSPAEAASAFSRAYELSEHPLAAFYRGYALQLNGSIREALPAYQVAAEAYPDSGTVLNNLGYAQLQLGRLDLALDTLREALSSAEDNPRIHVNLGLTYYGLGRYDEALQAWEQAVALEPSLESDLADIRSRAEERDVGR